MFKNKPLICVSSDGNYTDFCGKPFRRVLCSEANVRAVALAGGIPILTSEQLPEDYADLCDALILTGGCDIDPKYYGETILNDTVKLDAKRDEYEIALAKAFIARNKPIFAICRGFQLLNVIFGGTLYQDLVEQRNLVHYDPELRHPVTAEKGSILYNLFGESFIVNSTHHEAVKDLAPCLKATAHSPEGLVEAYEHESLPIMGVQFHPERLLDEWNDERTKDFLPYYKHYIDLVKKLNG